MPEIDKRNPDEMKRLDEFVSTHPSGSFMQSPWWARVKPNWESDYVYLEDANGDICASMSILSISNDGESSFLYIPRGPVADASDTDVIRRLLDEAAPVIERRNAFLLRMDPAILYSPTMVDRYQRIPGVRLRTRGTPGGEHSFSNPRLNMVLDLENHTYDSLIASYKKKLRYAIRRTEKDGLTTEVFRVDQKDYSDLLSVFHSLTIEMATRQGISYRPKEYFARLLRAFPHTYMSSTKDETGDILSAAISVPFQRQWHYLYAASADRKSHLQPSVQMIMCTIRQAIECGMTEFNFGGVFDFDIEDHLYLYKLKYCGENGQREFLGELDFVYDEAKYAEFLAH
ncbi:peptidoglycan bridge formation glycyltransferase FemA/FemB family protein [Arcanobacterium haemolyticum]|nr:peptidoglycan bridge formation glycyltransferase FemA/FemB family protein [Arcanobacterium haemolyticum]